MIPNETDWMVVGNAFRQAMRDNGFEIELLTEPAGIPSEEFLKEYDRVLFPGCGDRLKEMARKECLLRIHKECNSRNLWQKFVHILNFIWNG